MVYKMLRRGSTVGAVTGNTRHYAPGDKIEAPDGEFDHLPSGAYQTARLQSEQYEKRPASPTYTVGKHSGGGWYYLLRGGERIETKDGYEKAGPGKDEAEAEAERRNSTND